MDYAQRLRTLQMNLQPQQVFLLSRPADVQYYTGLANLNPEERESFFVVSTNSATLLYPSFSPVSKIKAIKYHAGHWPGDLVEVIRDVIDKQEINKIFIDKSSLFVNEYEALKEMALEFEEIDMTLLWQQRMTKDNKELKLLQKAGEITAAVMKKILKNLKAGVTEKEVALEVEMAIRSLGAERSSFPPVIAFGSHSALPHHQPTDTKLTKNTVVLVDIGAKYNNYCGDMTRTIWFGDKPSKKFLEVENLIKNAYKAAVAATQAGVTGSVVDSQARDIIKEASYGTKFIHTTGHGVGLEIHEYPSLYFKKDIVLHEGAVVTIEPGIYLEGEFGYRHENMVQVEKSSAKELTG